MSARSIAYSVLRQLALQAGLDDVGVVRAQYWEQTATFMEKWIAKGLNGNMEYLSRNCEKRYDIRQLVPGAQSVVVGLLTYNHSGHDYHRTLKSVLYSLQDLLTKRYGQQIVSEQYQHIFCDSAPVLERHYAHQAGLGFIGKNHQLIHPRLGSLVHIGELVLQTEVQGYDAKPLEEQCADCRRCIEACPGNALGGDQWDARKCIAYVTHKCMTCQNVCPYNETVI